MLTQFETWLLNELNNARLDFRDADPGESVDTMDAIRARKDGLEQVFDAYIRTLGLADLQRLREEGVI